jgi:hypothetical protein
MKTHSLTLSALLLFTSSLLFAQETVVFGDISSFNTNSLLHINSSSAGILLPRMTTSDREAIASPAAGLTVYDTDEGCLFVFTSSNGWSMLKPANTGMITMWYGSRSAFDNTGLGLGEMKGWALCNGQNNTVDLRSRFIVGFDTSVDEYDAIGASNLGTKYSYLDSTNLPAHNHSYSDPGHTHTGNIIENVAHRHSGVLVPGAGLTPQSGSGAPIQSLAYTSQSVQATTESSQSQLMGSLAAASAMLALDQTGGSESHENRPNYIAVFFIQKI